MTNYFVLCRWHLQLSLQTAPALEKVCGEICCPKTIRVDQGSEFVSRDLDLWAYFNGVTLDFSRPGKPTDNAFIEAFNSKVRSEYLNDHWFMSLDDACSKFEDWRRYYNEERTHSGISQSMRVTISNRSTRTVSSLLSALVNRFSKLLGPVACSCSFCFCRITAANGDEICTQCFSGLSTR